ncbi:M15 family metallopeptidase [Sporolactobacillus vineae]|uniref:M15 family metallopeptidase n=1 Tax=Sporolactobacillus vineae TaxID=444463 RepID=UPI000287E000|nr:M15 family metallopeptidase [Sporolactobacillus vineae]
MTSSVFTKQSEKLVAMENVSKKITIYPSYYLQKLPGTSPLLFLREGVAERIIRLADRLPGQLSLVLIDGWRSYETQRCLYDRAAARFRKLGHTEQQVKEEMTGFVAFPSRDPACPAPHYSGSAIDLTLAEGQDWLEMGTDFDDFTDKAGLTYYEGKEGLSGSALRARNNRRKLRHLMECAGFVPNPAEWWHYSYGDRTWANANHTIPLYGGTEK